VDGVRHRLAPDLASGGPGGVEVGGVPVGFGAGLRVRQIEGVREIGQLPADR